MSFEIPGAKASIVGIRFPFVLDKRVGRVVYKKERPLALVFKQGTQSVGKKESPVLVGGSGELQEGGPDINDDIGDSSECYRTLEVHKLHSIEHFVIGLDISGSMSDPVLPKDSTPKLQHVKGQLKVLKNHGLPDGTLITLLTFNDNASVAKTNSVLSLFIKLI